MSPKNKKEFTGINSIKEELGEESLTYHECSDNINDCQIQYKNNKIQNNISNEERHSTGSTKLKFLRLNQMILPQKHAKFLTKMTTLQ